MKMESQKQQEHVFFLATENIFIHVNKPFKIQQEMIEAKDFIPEAFMIHKIQDCEKSDIDCNSFLRVTRGERLMPAFESLELDDESSKWNSSFSLLEEDDAGGNDEDDWEDEDEDWDDEDEDWDEDDEEWDEEDDEWDEEDDADEDDDEDEDWEEGEEE